jgi:hypothetical protein
MPPTPEFEPILFFNSDDANTVRATSQFSIRGLNNSACRLIDSPLFVERFHICELLVVFSIFDTSSK